MNVNCKRVVPLTKSTSNPDILRWQTGNGSLFSYKQGKRETERNSCTKRFPMKSFVTYEYLAFSNFKLFTSLSLSLSHTHTRLTALFPGLPGWAGTRKVKPKWILLKQETVSGSDISWAVCKSAPCSRQITMPAPHHSVFYRPDALPAAQPTVSKHWRQFTSLNGTKIVPQQQHQKQINYLYQTHISRCGRMFDPQMLVCS